MHREKLFLCFGKTKRDVMTNEDAVKPLACLDYNMPTAIGVLPYHELLTSICDNYRCVYMCLNARMCACVIQRCSYVHKVIICFCHKLKTLLLFIKLSFPSYLCSDDGQAAYLIGRSFPMLYMHGRMSGVTSP